MAASAGVKPTEAKPSIRETLSTHQWLEHEISREQGALNEQMALEMGEAERPHGRAGGQTRSQPRHGTVRARALGSSRRRNGTFDTTQGLVVHRVRYVRYV